MTAHENKGRFAFPELDRVLHERARLGILSCMISCGTAVTFAELKELCDLTDGNLSRHLKALEEAGVAALEREREGSRPQTWISFTRGGRKRFLDCEWDLPDGTVLVLEVDGAHHMEVAHWDDDIKRQRKVVARHRHLLRATAMQARFEQADLVADLVAMGVPRHF